MRDFGNIIANYAKITSPGANTASGSVLARTGAGYFLGIFVTSSDNAGFLTVYDNTDATGTVMLAKFSVGTAVYYGFNTPIKFHTGLKVDSAGSVSCTIAYYY